MIHIYAMEYYSAIKKNELMSSAATGMQLEILTLSEVSQRKTNATWYHLYVESKIWHKWTCLQNRNRLRDIEYRLVVAKEEGGGRRMDWEFEANRCKLRHWEWISNEVLLRSTGNYIQSLGIDTMEENIRKEMYIYGWLGHFAAQQKRAQHCKSTILFLKRGTVIFFI